MESHKNMGLALCIKGCGFFGKSLKTLNLQASFDNSSSTLSDSKNSTSTGMIVKKRCHSCNKRIGLLGFDFRYGGVFCGTHRLS